MATFDYAKARLTAAKIINKFGENGTFTIPAADGGYDAFGNPVSNTPAVNLDGIVTPLLNYNKDEMDGETIQREDSYVFFDTDGEPEIGMNTTVNGEKYAVMNIEKLESAGGVNVYHKLQLRR